MLLADHQRRLAARLNEMYPLDGAEVAVNPLLDTGSLWCCDLDDRLVIHLGFTDADRLACQDPLGQKMYLTWLQTVADRKRRG